MPRTSGVTPVTAATFSSNSLATIVTLSPKRTREYSKRGETVIAIFATNVHGVVVQMRNVGVSSSATPNADATAFESTASKCTKIDGSSRSSYSSSASASAVSFAMDQCTGFSCRYTTPVSTRFANTSSTEDSYCGCIVRYGSA